MISEMRAPARRSYGRIQNLVELKDLIATQLDSFNWFKSEGLRELFDEINPITDYTGKNFELKFLDYEFGSPKFSVGVPQPGHDVRGPAPDPDPAHHQGDG